jgi:hypothetical protein
MSQKYRIYQLDPNNIADKVEEDGVLRKDWYNHPELGECLFKESRPSQAIITEARTDWTEKVVNEIANVLDLPVAQYELASGYFNNSPEIVEGVVSLNCIPRNVNLTFTGQQLLSRFIDYDPENPSQYTIENVLKALDLAKVKIPSNWESPIAGVSTDEDEDKLNISLSGYVNRYSQSCFQDGYNKVPNLTIFDRAARLYPDAAKIWQKQLALVTPDRINGIFDRIPDGRITPVAAKFAIDLLRYNRERIANLEIEPIRKSIPKKAPKKDRGGR